MRVAASVAVGVLCLDPHDPPTHAYASADHRPARLWHLPPSPAETESRRDEARQRRQPNSGFRTVLSVGGGVGRSLSLAWQSRVVREQTRYGLLRAYSATFDFEPHSSAVSAGGGCRLARMDRRGLKKDGLAAGVEAGCNNVYHLAITHSH